MGWMVNHVQVGDRVAVADHEVGRSAAVEPGQPGGRAGARLGAAGLAAEREGSVEQTVEALSRDVAWLRRQLNERQAS